MLTVDYDRLGAKPGDLVLDMGVARDGTHSKPCGAAVELWRSTRALKS